jgi:hypothetical protein
MGRREDTVSKRESDPVLLESDMKKNPGITLETGSGQTFYNYGESY